MSGSTPDSRLRLADVQFDAAMRLVNAAGRQTLLDRRSSSVFAVLADRLGECVGKDVLMRTAWPDQIVHENSLAKAISKLRGAIEGSGLEIVALYGVGYTLREVETPRIAVEPAPEPKANDQAKAAGSTHGRWLAVAAVLALTVGGFTWTAARESVAVPVRSAPPLTNDAPNARATILWVDDHPQNNVLEVEFLRQHRVAVHLARSTEDALKLLAMNHYQLVVSDLGRGDDRLAGLKMTETINQRKLAVPVIIYTISPKSPSGQEAQQRMVAEAGAAGLAVTPAEVRAKVLRMLDPQA